jgi:hypothetical protein
MPIGGAWIAPISRIPIAKSGSDGEPHSGGKGKAKL